MTKDTQEVFMHDPDSRRRKQVPGKARGLKPHLQRMLTGLLAAALLLASPGGPQFVLAQAHGEDFSAELAQLSELESRFAQMRAGLDRTRFDLDDLGLELAFEDAEAIVELLREQIAFEQYPGVLRGAQGTLIDGAGNSADQAVLLAILLGDAGYDVRIARGELSVDQAEALLLELQGRQAGEVAAGLQADLLISLDEATLAIISEQVESESLRLQQDTDSAAAFIRNELLVAGIKPAGTDLADLIAEAQDYFWVEYRLQDNEPWQAAHVAFSNPPESLVDLIATAHLESEIPEELQHRFRFQVFIEQRLGSDLKVKPVMAAWERPVANMTGVALTYANVPDGVTVDLGVGMTTMLGNTDFFIPMLNGDMPDGAQAFDMLGNNAVPEDTAAPAAGLFQSIGGLFGEAAGMLAGEDDPQDFVTLTSQWLEYTLIAPGGQETTYRRTVFDRIGLENRAEGRVELDGSTSQADVQAALTATHTFMVNAGSFNETYLADGNLAANEAMITYSQELLEGLAASAPNPPVPNADEQTALRRQDHLNLFHTIDNVLLPPDVVSYRPAPGLIVISNNWITNRAEVDVIANSRRAFQTVAGQLPVAAPEWVLQAGVWETRVEGLSIASSSGTSVSTFSAFEAATRDQLGFVTLASADAAGFEQLKLPLASLQAIKADLDEGFVVIAPAGIPAPGAHVAWWRVHAETGETLGRGSDGRGQETVEYAAQLQVMSNAGLAFSGAASLAGCAATTNNVVHYACCIMLAVSVGAVSMGIGAALAGAFAGGVVVSVVMLDFTAGTLLLIADVSGLTPDLCGRHAQNGDIQADASQCQAPAI
jgi:hypothetical protein